MTKKYISIITSVLFFCQGYGASSDEATEESDSLLSTIALKEMSVTGHKALTIRNELSNTLVYRRDTTAAAPIQTIEGALKLSPGVDVRERGAKGVQTDFLVRGGSFDQTMVSLNGINFTDARTGHQSHSLPIDINAVSSISIVDGVSGVGAYAGAVNIQTSPLRSRYLSAEVSGGMHTYLYGNLSGNYTINDFSIMALGSVRHSGGYIHNTDFTNYNAYVNARYHTKSAGMFEFQAGYQHRTFGANGFYSRKFPDQFETTSTALGSLRWQMTRNRLTLTANASYRYNTDFYELIKGDESKVPFNHHITHNVGAALGAAYDWGKAGETSLNADYTLNKIYSTVLGEETAPKTIGGISYNHQKERNVVNAILRHSVTFNALKISAAGGMSHSDYGTDGLWSAGINYAFSAKWRVGIGAVESMRLPTFTDLYYTATGYESDRNLVPEHATTYNLSANFNSSGWSASAYLYYRNGRNVIDWVKPEDSENWRSMQITRINTLGAELTGAYISSTWLRRIALSYGHIYQNSHTNSGMISAIAFDYMRNKLALMFDVMPFKDFTVSVTGTLFDRIGNYTDKSGTVCPYKPFFLLDARIAYRHAWWQVYVDGTNLTNTRYFDFGGLEMPGSWISGGLIVTI
ncbi:MAG: TonB-dependent receptor [Bacteroides sp.]|nr:TonB-dependent receptor [Bacteroides sp.]MCM1380065.1 TonB-dependent receptor [Bacteroides sp.]MCM1446402.1 TonB-dependent receptor [Prevotella sp.]